MVNGRRPDSRAARDGLQTGAAHDARVKTVPSLARRFLFGVRVGVFFWGVANPVAEVVDGDAEDVGARGFSGAGGGSGDTKKAKAMRRG